MRTTVVGLAAAAAVTAGALGAPPAQAGSAGYVALGDSYSSGTGTRSYLADGTSCQRSVYAYPALVSGSSRRPLSFRACSGATTADVVALQLGALGADTSHVSLTVGGNDAGFQDVLSTCAQPAWASDCGAAVDRAQRIVRSVLPARLDALHAAVRSRAPSARVVVGGYPRLFAGVDCNALTWFSATETARLNATADLLNAELQAAATAHGFAFADPTGAFTGHAVCGGPEWVNGLSSPVGESFHPNRTGHASGYAPLIGRALTGSTVTVTTALLRRAASSAGVMAQAQRPYAAHDRRIRARPFRLPDLTSGAVRAAAGRAGVDLRSRASIDRADAAYAAAQEAAWARQRGVRS